MPAVLHIVMYVDLVTTPSDVAVAAGCVMKAMQILDVLFMHACGEMSHGRPMNNSSWILNLAQEAHYHICHRLFGISLEVPYMGLAKWWSMVWRIMSATVTPVNRVRANTIIA